MTTNRLMISLQVFKNIYNAFIRDKVFFRVIVIQCRWDPGEGCKRQYTFKYYSKTQKVQLDYALHPYVIKKHVTRSGRIEWKYCCADFPVRERSNWHEHFHSAQGMVLLWIDSLLTFKELYYQYIDAIALNSSFRCNCV